MQYYLIWQRLSKAEGMAELQHNVLEIIFNDRCQELNPEQLPTKQELLSLSKCLTPTTKVEPF